MVSEATELALTPLAQGEVKTDDSARLRYQCFGAQGPLVVIANGIGVRYSSGAARQIAVLEPHYRVLCWDYRGMGESWLPDPARADVSMPRHARDLLALLAHLEAEQAVLVGWSMGVQVALETIRLAPERVAGFVALPGTYANAFQTAFPPPLARAMQRLFGWLERNPALVQHALELATRLPRLAFTVLSHGRFVGSRADRALFAAAVRDVASVEKGLYLRTLLELAHHDASDLLPQIICPTLVISGKLDLLSPSRVGREMARRIPRATHCEAPSATHFVSIEQPELVNHWLLEFLEELY